MRPRQSMGSILLLTLACLAVSLACVEFRFLRILAPVFSGGNADVTIFLGSSFVEGSLSVRIDGKLVENAFSRTAEGVFGRIPVASGPHRLRVAAHFQGPAGEAVVPLTQVRQFVAPAGAPVLIASEPLSGATNVPRTEWFRMLFAGPVSDAVRDTFELRCDDTSRDFALHELAGAELVLNPVGELPGGASCQLAWQAPDGPAVLPFETAPVGAPAAVIYDRTDPALIIPFPDDFWLVPDPSRATGQRVAIPEPDRPASVRLVINGFRPEMNQLDGFSPIGGIVVELSAAPDPDSLPLTPAASLDPLASVGLFDLTPGSSSFGRRIPFQLTPRSDLGPGFRLFHTLVIFPSIPLTPGGHYGFVMTRRAQVDPRRPFDPSNFLAAAIAAPLPGEAPEVERVRGLVDEVLSGVADRGRLPIPADDVALALRISIRSTDSIPDTLLAMKEQILERPVPTSRVTNCTSCPCSVTPAFFRPHVAAIVSGEWDAPNWRDGIFYMPRDVNGDPIVTGTQKLCFTLALPTAALDGPAPLTIYQHGNPGSAAGEVVSHASFSGLAEAGFALIGFTDVLNREISQDVVQQTLRVFLQLVVNQSMPDVWTEIYGEQLAFLAMLGGLDLDVLPLGAPDGAPDLDVAAPVTYVGISQGANHGQAFVTYAPEVVAAALVAGGRHQVQDLLHQDTRGLAPVLSTLRNIVPALTPPEVWGGLVFFQMLFDPHDGHNHAAFLYGNPVEVAGTTRKPSVLVIEGLNDSFVANNATRSLAWTMGPIPHLEPVHQTVSYLEPLPGPVSANIDPETTSAYVQYVPAGFPGLPPSAGCEFQLEGHFCAQLATASLMQRVIFFETALAEAAPTIADPLALESP